MPARRDGGDAMQPVDLLIDPNVQASNERRCVGVGVVQLEPVAPTLRRVSEPLVDDKPREGRRLRGLIEFAKRRLGRCPAVGGADNRRADSTEGHGIDTTAVGIEQRDRVARLAKAEAGPQPVALPFAAPDAEQARLAKRGAVGECERVVVAIAQRPTGEIDRHLAKVSQLDKVRLGRERRLHVHLVDDDRRLGGIGTGLAGRAGLGRAVAPVRRRAGVSQRIDQLERVAVAVGQAWPDAAVAVGHLDDTPPPGVEQGQALAVV